MSIRPAQPKDRARVVELATRAVSVDPLPLRVDKERMGASFDEVVAGNQHFMWVAEHEGVVVAGLAAHVSDGFWFQRSQASVLMFYTEQPGAGIALIREFARWVKSRPVIKMAVFSLERNADPRIVKLLSRLGFNLMFPQCVYVRGMS